MRWNRILKILHFCSIALWMGGAAALLPLLAVVDFSDPESARTTYLGLRGIAWNVIGWGGIGTVTTGLALAGWSPWRFFRYRWVTTKLVLAPVMVLFGMFYVEHHMLANLAAIEAGASAESLAVVHSKVQTGLAAMIVAFVMVIGLSVVKPWGRWRRAVSPTGQAS